METRHLTITFTVFGQGEHNVLNQRNCSHDAQVCLVRMLGLQENVGHLHGIQAEAGSMKNKEWITQPLQHKLLS